SGPHYVPYEVRSDCELVGRMSSLLIGAFDDREIAAGRERRRPVLDVLAATLRTADDALGALLMQPQELFPLLRIDGAAVVTDDVRSAGAVPPAEAIRAVADWLQAAGESGLFTTDSVATLAPEFAAIKDTCSGIV